MANAELKVVPLEQATNAELIIAAGFAGADEAEQQVANAADGIDLDQEQRQVLITYLNAIGYYNIQINTNERVEHPDAMIPFEVALPV